MCLFSYFRISDVSVGHFEIIKINMEFLLSDRRAFATKGMIQLGESWSFIKLNIYILAAQFNEYRWLITCTYVQVEYIRSYFYKL